MQQSIHRITTGVAAFASIVLGLLLPLGYFLVSFHYEAAVIRTAGAITARTVSSFAAMHPGLWPYMEDRLTDIMKEEAAATPGACGREISDADGRVAARLPCETPWPSLTVTRSVDIAGHPVGAVFLSRSVRPVLSKTGWMLLAGAAVGFLCFQALRRYPLQALDNALGALSDEKEKLNAVLAGMGDSVITTDKDLNVMIVNEKAQNLLRGNARELRNLPLTRMLPPGFFGPPEEQADFFERVLVHGERVLLPRDGAWPSPEEGERLFSISGAPIRDRNEVISGLVLLLREVTERRRLESEQTKIKQLEALGVLAGGIAHDFNNLMALVLGNVEMTLMELPPGNASRAMLEQVCHSIERARELTGRLITFSSGGEPAKELFSLQPLIRNLSGNILGGSPIHCRVDVDQNLHLVEADKVQISQVIQNLVLNAKEAMEDQGELVISAGNTKIEREGQGPLTPGDYVRVSFADTGPGVREDLKSKIFEPYFTTKDKFGQRGMGLGLAICLSILHKHGGHITVESRQGGGAIFHVFLPAHFSQA